jgi:hypothetical protein
LVEDEEDEIMMVVGGMVEVEGLVGVGLDFQGPKHQDQGRSDKDMPGGMVRTQYIMAGLDLKLVEAEGVLGRLVRQATFPLRARGEMV